MTEIPDFFEYLDRMVVFNTRFKLPRTIILYHDTESIKPIMKCINNIASDSKPKSYS